MTVTRQPVRPGRVSRRRGPCRPRSGGRPTSRMRGVPRAERSNLLSTRMRSSGFDAAGAAARARARRRRSARALRRDDGRARCSIAHELYLAEGGYPSPLGYRGFPKSICTSVNEVVAHGIPDDRALQDGDIVNCDVTIYLDGMHGDCSATFLVGDVAPEVRGARRGDRASAWNGHRGGSARRARSATSAGRSRTALDRTRLRDRSRARRSRDRRGVPRRPVRPSLRRAARPHAAAAGDGVHHRADAHPRGSRRSCNGTTVGRSRHSTVRPSAQFEHTLLVTRDGVEVLTA